MALLLQLLIGKAQETCTRVATRIIRFINSMLLQSRCTSLLQLRFTPWFGSHSSRLVNKPVEKPISCVSLFIMLLMVRYGATCVVRARPTLFRTHKDAMICTHKRPGTRTHVARCMHALRHKQEIRKIVGEKTNFAFFFACSSKRSRKDIKRLSGFWLFSLLNLSTLWPFPCGCLFV
jgi:hypothetical protein